MNEPSAKSEKLPGIRAETTLSATAMFDHEKLDVYRLELQFITWTTELLDEVSTKPRSKVAEVCDQLDRAGLSALLNTAEGNGKRQRQGRAKFFEDARGSATECAACLDALVAKRAVAADRILEGKKLLVRIVSMLSGLVDRFDMQAQLKDEPIHLDITSVAKAASYITRRSRTRTRITTRRKIRYGSN